MEVNLRRKEAKKRLKHYAHQRMKMKYENPKKKASPTPIKCTREQRSKLKLDQDLEKLIQDSPGLLLTRTL